MQIQLLSYDVKAPVSQGTHGVVTTVPSAREN
jgi:hypothetical protein